MGSRAPWVQVSPRLASSAAVALPRLGQGEQHIGAERALAAAGLAEQGQLAMGGQGLQGGDRPGFGRFAGLASEASAVARQPLGQGCVDAGSTRSCPAPHRRRRAAAARDAALVDG